jgi:crossover junction endodeoxyribonuclease RuvC
MPMPLAGNELDLAELANQTRRLQFEGAEVRAIVERVHAMPSQGVSSTFTFGKGFGGVLGVFAALGVPVLLPTPQAWKKKILAGTKQDKAAAVAWARRVYPGVPLVLARCRKPHDGMADALCIAEWGRLEEGGRTR